MVLPPQASPPLLTGGPPQAARAPSPWQLAPQPNAREGAGPAHFLKAHQQTVSLFGKKKKSKKKSPEKIEKFNKLNAGEPFSHSTRMSCQH